jgi:hypothetical protein
MDIQDLKLRIQLAILLPDKYTQEEKEELDNAAWEYLTTQKAPVAKLQCSDGLVAIVDIWEKSAMEADKEAKVFAKGFNFDSAERLQSQAYIYRHCAKMLNEEIGN